MTTYEQHNIDGTIEVIDQITGALQARKMLLTCERSCRLCGEDFMEGEQIEATFPCSLDLSSGRGAGPWEPGGYTSRWIRQQAVEIIEMSRGKVIHSLSGGSNLHYAK
jgi:hypothetical protein